MMRYGGVILLWVVCVCVCGGAQVVPAHLPLACAVSSLHSPPTPHRSSPMAYPAVRSLPKLPLPLRPEAEYLIVGLLVRPVGHQAQSLAIAMRSPAIHYPLYKGSATPSCRQNSTLGFGNAVAGAAGTVSAHDCTHHTMIQTPFLTASSSSDRPAPPPVASWRSLTCAILALAPAIFISRLGWVGIKVTDTALHLNHAPVLLVHPSARAAAYGVTTLTR